jgi:hypothetical protein
MAFPNVVIPKLLLPSSDLKSAAELAYLDFLADEEMARQRAILKARQYHDGAQVTFLTERLRQFLAVDASTVFRMNVCRGVVMAVAERLIVNGFSCADETEYDGTTQAQWAQTVWQQSDMDEKADDVHEDALAESEHFVIVDWDTENARPRFTPHPRFVDAQVGGDSFGVKMVYPDDDYNQAPLYAVKRWTDDSDGRNAHQRMTLYYPDRVEKYVMDGARWVAIRDDGDTAWPIVWSDKHGKPLGIPVIHFRNRKLRAENWDAIPLQDAINKSLIDLLAGADTSAFRILYALGFIPTTDGNAPKDDGSNLLAVEPGGFVWTTKSRSEAEFGAIDPADLGKLLDVLQQLVMWMSVVTDTPASRYQFSGHIAAEGTLKEQQEPLLAKVRKRQVSFGNAWARCMAMARRLSNTFGNTDFDESFAFTTLWADAQPRNEKDHIETVVLKREKLGITQEQAWREADYDEETIQQMLRSEEYQAKLGMLKLALNNNGG